MKTLHRHARVTASLVTLLLFAATAAARESFPFQPGETLAVTGSVTTVSGQPLPELEVVLEAAKMGFSLRPFGMTKKEIARTAARTDDRGQFSLQWPWRAGFDRFEILVTLRVREEEGEQLRVLDRQDITARVTRGSPVSIGFVIQDAASLEKLRSFLAEDRSEDEERVYQEHGRPDRIDRLELGDSVDAAWWYFELGRVFRFRGGHLEREESFEPVRPF